MATSSHDDLVEQAASNLSLQQLTSITISLIMEVTQEIAQLKKMRLVTCILRYGVTIYLALLEERSYRQRENERKKIRECHRNETPNDAIQSKLTAVEESIKEDREKSALESKQYYVDTDVTFIENLLSGGALTGYLDVLLVASFGNSTNNPQGRRKLSTKVVKSRGGFLGGVEKDIDDIQYLIGRDKYKNMLPIYKDVKAHNRDVILKKFEGQMKNCEKSGLIVWYAGHGEEEIGNWCLSHATITFKEIFILYLKVFVGKLLYIVSDCCYSGQWVKRCTEELDSQGIGACGHQARKKNILIKVFASCMPDEVAIDPAFTQKGVTVSDGRIGFEEFEAEETVKCDDGVMKKVKQHPFLFDSTEIRCLQLDGLSGSCRLPEISHNYSWSWQDLATKDLEKLPSARIHLVKTTCIDKPCWFYVLTSKQSEGPDIQRDFIIASGWGSSPPVKTSKRVIEYQPDYEL